MTFKNRNNTPDRRNVPGLHTQSFGRDLAGGINDKIIILVINSCRDG